MTLLAHDKITAQHRAGQAYVYVRQSTLKQVQQHQESQRNQYALVQRAIELGWRPPQVSVIDADLGQSGQDSQRPGFQELVAAVSLGRVGIIFAYEASRLARNNRDWYTLLDLATIVGTLIADTEGTNLAKISWLFRVFGESELATLLWSKEIGPLTPA
jgi:DNA invertase Pin-like site-specific DNA recombinase